jgi:N-acetylneuraminic acid mutarotase
MNTRKYDRENAHTESNEQRMVPVRLRQETSSGSHLVQYNHNPTQIRHEETKLQQVPEDSQDAQNDYTWQIQTAYSNLYAVGPKPLSLWGCAGAQHGDKLYMFGGRDSDSICRSWFYGLNLTTQSFSVLKTSAVPRCREGHSMISYRDKLIVFGGCDGDDDRTELFNDVCILDLKSKRWSYPPLSGKVPEAREGHAAWTYRKSMVVYGGIGRSSLLSDFHMLDLKQNIWYELEQIGQLPGPRESMGFTNLNDKLYIFGGNISEPNAEEDEYTDDLYEILIENRKYAHCDKVVKKDSWPPKRLSHSLNACNDAHLILFGGESFLEAMSDVWVFNVYTRLWKKLCITNELDGRMAHVSCVYNNSLYIFGGMGSDKSAKGDLCVLNINKLKVALYQNFEAIKNNTEVQEKATASAKQNCHSCPNCGHTQETCKFLSDHPEISYPKFHFYAKCQIPMSIIEQLATTYEDIGMSLVTAICNLTHVEATIKCLRKVKMNRGEVLRLTPAAEKIDFTNLEIKQDDDTFNIRKSILDNIQNYEPFSEANVLEIQICHPHKPEDIAHYLGGTSLRNVIVPFFRISPVVLLISKSREFLTVGLVHKSEKYVPFYFCVFDSSNHPLFPEQNIFEANLKHILYKSSIKVTDIFSQTYGTRILLYTSLFKPSDNDILYNNEGKEMSLRETLSLYYLKNRGSMHFTIQKQEVEFNTLANEIDLRSEVFKVSHECKVIYSSNESLPFYLLIYYRNELYYCGSKSDSKLKRHRGEGTVMVILKNERLVDTQNRVIFT